MNEQVVYTGYESLEEALARLALHQGFISCDTETVKTTDKTCIGIGFGLGATQAIYFMAYNDPSSGHHRGPYFDLAIQVLLDKRPKIFFNAPFDLDVVERLDAVPPLWEDVAPMCRIQALPNSLEENSNIVLGREHTTIQDILPKGKTMLSLDADVVGYKCLNDCIVTWMLYALVQGDRWVGEYTGSPDDSFVWMDLCGNKYDVTPQMIAAYRLDRALIPLLRRMSKRGLKLDQDKLLEHYREFADKKFHYLSICQQQFGFNPGSNQQTGLVLAYRGNHLPWTKKGRYKQLAVGEDELIRLTDPLAHLVLEYRQAADKVSDIIEPFLGKPRGAAGKKTTMKDWTFPERAWCNWRLDLATSRLASSGDADKSSSRNLQNITPSLRDVFSPDDDSTGQAVFTWWDLSQIEMRIFADFSGDPELLGAYDRNESVHLMTMKALFPGQWKYTCCSKDKCTCPEGMSVENPLYVDSKTFNFAMIYFAKAVTLAKQTKRPIAQCEELKSRWLDKYAKGYSYMLWAMEEGWDRGWVPTLEGRRIRLPDEEQQGPEHRGICGINYRVQGTAAWPLKKAMLRSEDVFHFDQRLQVHDEMLINGRVEIPSEFNELLPGIPTPFEVKYGPKWA